MFLPRTMEILSRLLCVAIVTLAIGFAGLLLVARAQGFKVLSVQTGSMVPALHPGDAVIVRTQKLGKLQAGEIISYHSPASPELIITHRLVRIDYKTGWLITKGDHLTHADSAFPSRLVVGRVVLLAPGFGAVLNALRSPIGLLIGLYLPAIAIVILEVKRLMGRYGRQVYRLQTAR